MYSQRVGYFIIKPLKEALVIRWRQTFLNDEIRLHVVAVLDLQTLSKHSTSTSCGGDGFKLYGHSITTNFRSKQNSSILPTTTLRLRHTCTRDMNLKRISAIGTNPHRNFLLVFKCGIVSKKSRSVGLGRVSAPSTPKVSRKALNPIVEFPIDIYTI